VKYFALNLENLVTEVFLKKLKEKGEDKHIKLIDYIKMDI
jgi:hypothetical protein